MNTYELINNLECKGIAIEIDGDALFLSPKQKVTEDLLDITKERKAEIIAYLSVPKLPRQLVRLVEAASNGVLDIPVRGVADVSSYVQAWACTYLTSDRAEALKRLWEVYRQWEEERLATKN